MRILLDTHLLIWALTGSTKLPSEARVAIEDSRNDVLFSAASIWEIGIKRQLRRLDFSFSPRAIVAASTDAGFTELPINSTAAARVGELPTHHRDPFDRILIAQAFEEPAKLFTVDKQLAAYGDLVTLV
jgi:PIN domain nuclease of toxin-antitoxin system